MGWALMGSRRRTVITAQKHAPARAATVVQAGSRPFTPRAAYKPHKTALIAGSQMIHWAKARDGSSATAGIAV